MVQQIVNGAPLVVEYGTQDLSTVPLPREQIAIPQHLPKFFFFASQGPETEELMTGAELLKTYGADSFDIRSKFFNHQTLFALAAIANGNAIMAKRIVPEDAGPEANITLWLDVLPTTVDTYLRNPDGSIQTDIGGDPVLDETTGAVDGFKVKFVVTNYNSVSTLAAGFGQATQAVGDQSDPDTLVQSTRYPILQLKLSSKGANGNFAGIRLSAPTSKSVTTMPTKMMETYKAYPYFINVIKKPNVNSSPKVVETLFGEQGLTGTFKADVIDPVTDKELYLGDIFLDSYRNLEDVRYPKLYGDFGDIHVYQDNIDTLVGMFHQKETPFIDSSFYDFTDSVNDKHLFNFISGVSSNGAPYQSFVFAEANNSVRLTPLTNVYAAGGTDGTVDNASFATAVGIYMDRYLDPNDELMDIAKHVESIIYDSGFPLETKKKLCNFIALRKDTFVILGTHTDDGPELTASEEYSLGISLRTQLRLTPESEYFGTSVMRGLVMGRSGKIRGSKWKKPTSAAYEVLVKSSKYMGASNGRWKNGSNFDGAPGSIIDTMFDFNIEWVSNAVRNRNWDVGLNYVLRYDHKSFFLPALKTVYDDDTSVLNSYLTAMAIGYLNKVGHAAWREFSGSVLSGPQLVDRVNEFVNDRTKDRFDGRYIIIPKATITDMDEARGFSWTLPIVIGAPGMKTVETTYVQAKRIQDVIAEQQ